MIITNIKEFREQNKMSQTELAQLVGVRRETIGHLENGHYNPSLVLAAKIAKVFNVTIDQCVKTAPLSGYWERYVYNYR